MSAHHLTVATSGENCNIMMPFLVWSCQSRPHTRDKTCVSSCVIPNTSPQVTHLAACHSLCVACTQVSLLIIWPIGNAEQTEMKRQVSLFGKHFNQCEDRGMTSWLLGRVSRKGEDVCTYSLIITLTLDPSCPQWYPCVAILIGYLVSWLHHHIYSMIPVQVV